MRKSVKVSLTAVFAALHAVLYFISFGLWRNWGIYLESLEGIILGPQAGFTAALIGSVIARLVKPDDFWMFGIIAEPVSVLMAGFLARAKWKPALAVFAIMLAAYFIHPFGRALPLWTILDVLLAAILIYPAAKLGKNLFTTDFKRLPIALVLVSFVCIAADSLVRIFLLVPCGLYSLFFGSFEVLYMVFVEAAVSSYIEDLIVVLVSLIVGAPLLTTMVKLKILNKVEK
ncbi:MAG: hypothetical protein ACPLKQ_04075 [Candidatus Bathyarchaeales archaeon]